MTSQIGKTCISNEDIMERNLPQVDIDYFDEVEGRN
jgi:hypothetical protein